MLGLHFFRSQSISKKLTDILFHQILHQRTPQSPQIRHSSEHTLRSWLCLNWNLIQRHSSSLWRVKPNHLYFESTIEDVNERHSWQGCEDISWISHYTQIEFSLSWESMRLGHLAYEKYDLYDPLNHIWEETKNQRESLLSGLNIKETHTLLFKYRWGG